MAERTSRARAKAGIPGGSLGRGLAALGLLAASAASAASGGPDGFGYTWRDSLGPDVTYNWVDISAVGTDITVVADDATMGFDPLSFAMPYYGGLYTQLAATTNGWVSLVDGTTSGYGNGPLPNTADPRGIIALFWDDLDMRNAGLVLFADLGTSAVVTYKGVPKLSDPASAFTFQVILHDDGRIVVQYQEMLGDTASATLGIESPDELNGLTVHNNSPAIPTANYAVEFLPPAPIPVDLACPGTPLACGQTVVADLGTGAANQSAYRCTATSYAGREHVYSFDQATPATVRVVLETLSGNPDIIALYGCDPERCARLPTDVVEIPNFSGTLIVVIDSRLGEEGRYRLRVDCAPLASNVDCANPRDLDCGNRLTGDTRLGTANQDVYWCSTTAYTGAEQVYLIDSPAPQTIRIELTSTSGDQDLIVINACDPNDCETLPGDSALLEDAVGQYIVVVDSRAGNEGTYTISVECLVEGFPFCNGEALLETDPPGYGSTGAWRVFGWLFHPFDTHDFALRVDGTTTSSTGGSCPAFTSTAFGALPPSGPAFVTWERTDGRVDVTIEETNYGGCCGLLVTMEVTNTGTAPHFYDFRAYHDTAFGDGDGTCTTGVVDGGPIEVNGVEYLQEMDLLTIGGDTCEGQVQMSSAEHPGEVRASYQMLGPNLPTTMEFIDWWDDGSPCAQWTGFVSGETIGDCGDDNALLFIWRFPAGAGTLAPGESATAQYRIGLECAWPCNVICESPVLSSGSASDVNACNQGVKLEWSAATFPAAGNGVYHVYRSTVSHADALASGPMTLPAGITATTFTDPTTVAGTSYFYVVQAESLDYLGCGTGPRTGSTHELNLNVVTDLADLLGPAADVGNALRATGHTDTTVDFVWPTAPPVGAGERYMVLRSDDDPQGPFVPVATPLLPAWTDPDAPPTFAPSHVWFYDVRLSDDCDNVSPN